MFKVGDNFTSNFIVSKSTHEGFVHLFNDKNPLHTNEKFALDKGFEGKVMHGNILNGFLSYFIGECLSIKNVIIHRQEIQYKNPVYLNDELLLLAKVTGVFESVNAVEFKFSFSNQEKIVVARGKIQIGII